MVGAEDVTRIYQYLSTQGIQVWITGGWGIDALLGKHTRLHKDLDVIMLLDDIARLREILSSDGYELKELWSENRWVIDSHGVETATAFVLQDPKGLQLDVHSMRFDENGNGIPAWEAQEGFIFSPQDLGGEGMVAGKVVRCLSPDKQLICHTGYELPEYQLRDLESLYKKFGGFDIKQSSDSG
jgi:lincosamide nucleotidyltransferase A/C/D/E